MSAVLTETTTLIPARTWAVDPVHSSIRWDVIDLDAGMKSISGRFTEFEGTVEGGEEQAASGTVRTASVLTDHEVRDNHLRSSDMLDTDRARRREPPQDRRRTDDQGGSGRGRARREVPGRRDRRRRRREDPVPR